MNMCVRLCFYCFTQKKKEKVKLWLKITWTHRNFMRLIQNCILFFWFEVNSNAFTWEKGSSSAFFTIVSFFLDWFMECQLISIHVADFEFVNQISSTFSKYSMHLKMENYDSYSAISILEKRKQNEMILRKKFRAQYKRSEWM